MPFARLAENLRNLCVFPVISWTYFIQNSKIQIIRYGTCVPYGQHGERENDEREICVIWGERVEGRRHV